MQVLTAQGAETNAAAQAVQAGEADIFTLWLSCRRYVLRQARRLHRAFDGGRGVELEDLEQAGFLALERAVQTWKPDSGAFSTWLTLHLKSEFLAVYRMRTERERKDPLNSAVSLDLPPAGAEVEDNCALRDVIPDAAAERAFENAERDELREAVRRIVAALPEDQQDAITGEFWHGRTADPGIRRAAFKTLRKPENREKLQAYRTILG